MTHSLPGGPAYWGRFLAVGGQVAIRKPHPCRSIVGVFLLLNGLLRISAGESCGAVWLWNTVAAAAGIAADLRQTAASGSGTGDAS